MISLEPVRPVGSTWTDDQWQAIAARGQNVLVAAAAGSGKTAVLVERIIRRIMDENEPIDVDRLLVATFTKAAASEMRERIRDALEKALLDNPDSDHLRRQLALLGRASITTLHSFCLEVVQRNIHALPLDPGFRIANNTEAELMRQDALEDVLETYYADSVEDSPFWRLVDWYGSGRGDDGPLLKLILELYESSRSHPEPNRWLSDMAECFETGETNVYEEGHPAFRSLLEDVRLELTGLARMLSEAIELCRLPGGPAHYEPTLQDDLVMTEHLETCAQSGWGTLFQAFQSLTFGNLKAVRKDDLDKAVQEQTKKLRDTVKSQLQKLQEELFTRSPEQFLSELNDTAPLMRMLVELVRAFEARFAAVKADKSLVDFSDLEHFALLVLRGSDDEAGQIKPSPAAEAYQEQFAEVLLDEYQDTNQVQETIVFLISKPYPGNRFMVGDVKQSIYRFRLADPGLFLHKYKTYQKRTGSMEQAGAAAIHEERQTDAAAETGRRIDLARNFRSRQEVVHSVNFLFRQLMNEAVGEVEYDEAAELVYGAGYPELTNMEQSFAAELVLLDRSALKGDGSEESGGYSAPDVEETDLESESIGASLDDTAELETAELEARLIGRRIRQMIGHEGGKPFLVYDKKVKGLRPLEYRDIVILLRATQAWAPSMIEELKKLGIPAYAELSTGYFEATEVEVMLSLLKVIDNPLQDIPMAAVLRSPIAGFTAEELARIRLRQRSGSFAEAVRAAATGDSPAVDLVDEGAPVERNAEIQLRDRLNTFMRKVAEWRTDAREGSLAELIWRIYRDTAYYDFVGGMPGGIQRQANLRALYDRARQYESTSLRGLFRFLRFVERMRDSGEDLGTARALGEQENVVRIMTIHKSKGLEFPVVFVAGMAKMFNMMDLNGSFLLHKELGFGPKYVDMALRVSYPTLQHIAIRRRIRKETLAEELRILYVALTRAREKLILIGTTAKLEKLLTQWGRVLNCESELLPDFDRFQAKSYLDWVGPAVFRHAHAAPLRDRVGLPWQARSFWLEEQSVFSVNVIRAEELQQGEEERLDDTVRQAVLEQIVRMKPLELGDTAYRDEIDTRLRFQYKYGEASRMLSKTTVTELKRLSELQPPDAEEWESNRVVPGEQAKKPIFRRPQFMESRTMTAAERGTVYHAVMQVLPLKPGLTEADIAETIALMREKRSLTDVQAKAVDPAVLASFFQSDIGRELSSSARVMRELPFTYGLKAGELHSDTGETVQDETVIIQGVIDCLFETEGGLVLLDYKTDAVKDLSDEALIERYRIQLSLYARAVQEIWRRPVTKAVLYFFDGCRTVELFGGR